MRKDYTLSAPRVPVLVSLTLALVVFGGLHAGWAQLEPAVNEEPTEVPPELASATMEPIRSPGDPMPSSSVASVAAPGGPVLSAEDRELFRLAHEAADRNNWEAARGFATRGTSPIGKLTVEWRYLLDEESGASFYAIRDFLFQHPNWPRREQMLERAEKTMPAELGPDEIIAWYSGHRLVTSEGALKLATAQLASNKTAEATATVRRIWATMALTPKQEAEARVTFASLLSTDDHRARLERVLSTEGIAEANRLMVYVDEDTKALARARLDLKTKPAAVFDAAASLEPKVANDPRYVLDLARALRRAGDRDEEAWAAMARVEASPLLDANRVWPERHVMARDALKVRRYETAYAMVSRHNMTGGANFADAEFLSGWIALRQLNKADAALAHFQRMAGAVTLPISRARARYWIGRTFEALGNTQQAIAAYRAGAADPGTYYGQLALARIDEAPMLNMVGTLPDIASVKPAFDQDERVRAMHVFADTGQSVLLRIFAMNIAAEAEVPGYFSLLSEFMAAAGDRAAALRIAKLASYKNVTLVQHFVPLMELPPVSGGADVEPALVLGLTRQESEFDAGAVSNAGARGLMQLMPGTARATARSIGIPYSPARLSDPDYNVKLGMAHVAELLDAWQGSYILVIASYNAGSGNVRNWIATFGDPRDGTLDPIDWVELIPFGETRNYVQRVLENTNVYRNRLAGRADRLQIVADLYRPNAPIAAPAMIVRNEETAPAR